MAKYELFAKRGKQIQSDVLVYDLMPEKLRVQIRYIWEDALALERAYDAYANEANRNFDYIRNYICRELGLRSLYEYAHKVIHPTEECVEYLMNGEDTEVLLSLIELSIISIGNLHESLRDYPHWEFKIKMSEKDAIEELNNRFRENSFGYEFSNGILIRKDSEILHKESVKPALYLLQEQEFEGALDEFLKAYDHYRKGNFGDSILNAGKAFESTMKTIGHKESWGLTGKENASDLINLLISNHVIPGYLQNSLIGLGTVRNKVAGHGQGAAPVAVPEHLVNYALHLCGTNIVMLIEAYKEFSK